MWTVQCSSPTGDDDVNAQGIDPVAVKVLNLAPTVELSGPYSGHVDSLITFEAAVADPGKDDTHVIAWDLGDGTSGQGRTVEHAYADAGSYVVVVTVTDKNGDIGIGTVDVRVPDLRPRGFRKHRHVNENLAGTRLILSDAVLAELSQARRTYRLSQQETD